MKETWLVLDCNFLCWRAFHSTGALKWGKTQTGAVYGFLVAVKTLMDHFGTRRVVFCWDHGEPLRTKIYSKYKADRAHKKKAKTTEEREARAAFYSQVNRLRHSYLRALGFRNVFFEEGYEADDLIATTCDAVTERGGISIIVSADKDFYQLLRSDVRCYNPTTQRMMTVEKFQEEWGIGPMAWVIVKGMAGCASDNIPGIDGVGEKTAAKWIAGKIAKNSLTDSRCKSMPNWMRARNNKLVTIPYPDTPEFILRDDRVTEEKWIALMDRLGMKSLRNSWEN